MKWLNIIISLLGKSVPYFSLYCQRNGNNDFKRSQWTYYFQERLKQLFRESNTSHLSSAQGSARGGSGIPVYPQKIRQNTQNSSKYTQNYTQVYFIPEIQRKWYTKYPYLSCNIPYTRFKKPLYTVYPKTLADPV